MTILPQQKEALRRFYLASRRSLHEDDWREGSRLIRLHLESSVLYKEADTILTYVSAKDNEVDTHDLIDHALALGKNVLIPVVDKEPSRLDWAVLRDRSVLKRGAFGLFEPRVEDLHKAIPPVGALCLTPGVAFTMRGERIGYGGGYYDRFLKSFNGTAVGLGFEIQLVKELPTTCLDFRLEYLVTEKGLFRTHTPNMR